MEIRSLFISVSGPYDYRLFSDTVKISNSLLYPFPNYSVSKLSQKHKLRYVKNANIVITRKKLKTSKTIRNI